jgi:hypothetical protein
MGLAGDGPSRGQSGARSAADRRAQSPAHTYREVELERMYAVVGCSDCEMLWIVEGRPERTECPRCGASRNHEARRKFVRTDDEDHAREVRASMLAARSDQSEAFAELDSFAALEAQVESAGIDDETYLAESGIDPEAVEAAGDRDTGRQSREQIVRGAVRDLDEPTAEAVRSYASERGVPADYTDRALEKLEQAGELLERDGVLRLL